MPKPTRRAPLKLPSRTALLLPFEVIVHLARPASVSQSRQAATTRSPGANGCATLATSVLLVLIRCSLTSLAAQTKSQAADSPQTNSLKRADQAFRAGYAAAEAGDLPAAQASFAEAVRLAPQAAEGHEALEQFTAAQKLKSPNTDLETDIALAEVDLGQPEEAIAHFEIALRLAQHQGQELVDAVFYDGYGRALAAIHRLDQAIAQFNLEVELTAPSAELNDMIGSLCVQQGDFDSARLRFEQASALDA